MPKKYRRGILGTLLTALSLFLLSGCSSQYPVLDPAGPVGEEELHLILMSTILTLIVVIPVIILLFIIISKYRDRPNRKAPYQPEWAESKVLEIVWWSIPIIIIAILGTYTTRSIYHLTKPPTTSEPPLTIQVTSLDWKWVFMYPDQGVATVNTLEIPTGRPIQFVLTTDGPMNSFWIPKLGGQEMTMPGMAMRLWLQSNEVGVFTGKGANFSGKGFTHMSFKVHSVSSKDFNNWVSHTKAVAPVMTQATFEKLEKPSVVQPKLFSSYPKSIYTDILKKNGGSNMKDWMLNSKDPSKSMSKDMPGMDMSGSNK